MAIIDNPQMFSNELEATVKQCFARIEPALMQMARDIANESVQILMPVLIRDELRKMVTVEFKSQLLDRMNITVTLGDEHGD